MEEAKQAIGRVIRKIFKLKKKKVIIIIAIVMTIIALAAGQYFMAVHVDGKETDDDWSSTPYAAGQYINGISVDNNGTLSSSISAQKLWDKMLKNNSRVDEYLDSSKELARLMKAEIVTQYPDTRSEEEISKNENIDWKTIFEEDSDTLQGIIKFYRKDPNNNTSRMTYVEPQILEGWIEEYNTTGNENIKNKILSHFTLRKDTDSNNTNVSTSGKMANVSEKIVKEATKMSTYGLSGSVCQTWVGTVYDKAGFGYTPSGCCAYLAGTKWGISSDFSKIVNGAAVWTGQGSYQFTTSCSHGSQRRMWTCRYLLQG